MTDETYEALSEHRHELIRASRVDIGEHFGKAINAASADDLEWLHERLETQLAETPHHVKDEAVLTKLQTKTRTQLILVRGVLGNKRSVEKSEQQRDAKRQATVATWTSIISAVTSVAAIILSIIALVNSGH